MPLTPEVKAKTLIALRSGEYEQHRGSIGDFDSKCLCCIGVAAHTNGLKRGGTSAASEHLGLSYEEEFEWITWNDSEDKSFAEIADLIEQKY